jgi:hypothetical protein
MFSQPLWHAFVHSLAGDKATPHQTHTHTQDTHTHKTHTHTRHTHTHKQHTHTTHTHTNLYLRLPKAERGKIASASGLQRLVHAVRRMLPSLSGARCNDEPQKISWKKSGGVIRYASTWQPMEQVIEGVHARCFRDCSLDASGSACYMLYRERMLDALGSAC